MRITHSDEQEEFRRVVRRFLEDHSPPADVRRLMETPEGFDREVWRHLCDQLGLPAVHIPEEYGGQGFGFVELGIVLEEMGRALLCAPYFASAVLTATAILEGATPTHKKELLPLLASGESIGALAVTEPNGRWDAAGIETTARPNDGAFLLDGVKSYVLDGQTADLLLVAAREPGSSGETGLSLFAVASDADGLLRRPLATADATRKQSRLEFSGVRAELVGEQGSAGPALARTFDLAAIALANECVGGAQRVLEESVEYAKTRVQFGRPIGSFQAIKHRCADMLLDVELARSAAHYAAAAVAEGNDEVPALASLAKAFACDAYVRAASENIQIHGGVGFTWEHDAHLYFKRAKSAEVFLGDPAHHRELLAQRLGV
jgi:alkylation response protein AidB-like acyl-CoA dehydrogenase